MKKIMERDVQGENQSRFAKNPKYFSERCICARFCSRHATAGALGALPPNEKMGMVLIPNKVHNLEIYIGKEGFCPFKEHI